MRPICVKVSDHLYQMLEKKAKEHETKLSNIVRECIRIGLQNLDYISKREKENFNIQTYYLLEKFIQETVEDGEVICRMAKTLAERESRESQDSQKSQEFTESQESKGDDSI